MAVIVLAVRFAFIGFEAAPVATIMIPVVVELAVLKLAADRDVVAVAWRGGLADIATAVKHARRTIRVIPMSVRCFIGLYPPLSWKLILRPKSDQRPTEKHVC